MKIIYEVIARRVPNKGDLFLTKTNEIRRCKGGASRRSYSKYIVGKAKIEDPYPEIRGGNS